MTTRELLEKAAKAAGYTDVEYVDMRGWGEMRYGLEEGISCNEVSWYWSPLEDDGDALRLAINLNLTLTPIGGSDLVGKSVGCKYEFTRLSITRAAAAMWDAKQECEK